MQLGKLLSGHETTFATSAKSCSGSLHGRLGEFIRQTARSTLSARLTLIPRQGLASQAKSLIWNEVQKVARELLPSPFARSQGRVYVDENCSAGGTRRRR